MQPQPFDPGYDYEQDKAVEDRLDSLAKRMVIDGDASYSVVHEAAGELRALRNLIKHMERRINSLMRELEQERGECDE